ncbi:MAG: sensor histidine kinase [Methanobacteriaceae archaeon]|nr:sensor histidine kinase [Methanobacteriaceae archaeon]MDO9628094.1 sensor histidine kinase [Methanobacteriaceae archaeon]
MSLVHEKLYRSSDIAQVEMSSYTQHLVDDLVRNYGRHDLDIFVDIAEVKVGIDTAIPCGLIINELVSNSLKHAFPDNKLGEIRIKFNKNASNEFELVIQDNGVGISPEIDLKHSETLGLELVSSLINQLDGSLQMQKSPGATFKIKFQEIKYSKRI